jgi:ankyrin repeat protein
VNATQLAEILLSYPYVINRIKKLSEFAESEKYKKICNNEIKREDDEILKFAKRAFESIKSTKNAGRIKENIQNLAKEIQNSYSNLKDRTINLNTKDEIFTDDYKFSKESNDSNATYKGKTENPTKENSSINGKHQKYKLFKAIIDENVNEVKTIIEEGVNLNSSDKSGDTPLHLSVTLGSLEITRLLLSNGAYIDQPNKLGETPLKIAERKNLPEIALILKKECKHFVSIS